MADEDTSILYDLIIHTEWPLEGEPLCKAGFDIGQLRGSLLKKLHKVAQNSFWGLLSGIQYTFSGTSSIQGLPAQLYKIVGSSLQWQMTLSSDGKLLAILQDQWIEIRSVRDDFGSVIVKCPVEEDSLPQWRKVTWSPDSSMIACAYSWGDVSVFDLAGELLFNIAQKTSSLRSDLGNAVAGLVFIDHKHSSQWSAELLVISYQGYLENYLVSPINGFQANHSFSFGGVLPRGICTVLYHPQHNMLIVGAPVTLPLDNNRESILASANGITAWRILSGFPYYKLIEDESFQAKRAGMGFLSNLWTSGAVRDGARLMNLSPDGTQLAVLHLTGTLSLWHLPSLRHQQAWYPDDQWTVTRFSWLFVRLALSGLSAWLPGQDYIRCWAQLPMVEKQNTQVKLHKALSKDSIKQEKAFTGLIDVNWWSEEALILAHSRGAVTVSSFNDSLINLLGHSPEWCEPWSLITSAHDGGFLILECENTIKISRPKLSVISAENLDMHEDWEDSEDDEPTVMSRGKDIAKQAMFFLTESEKFHPPTKRPKILHRTYRLVCIKSTTPEELYARKIEQEHYGEALVLAQTYGLDSDLVYQKQWRKAQVSVASIHDYLSKVKNRLWVLDECVERVPGDYDATKELLVYGLHGTDARVLATLHQGKSKTPFIVKPKEQEEEEEEEEEERKERQRKLEEALHFESFNLEQKDVCRYRLKLLQYLDRLATYEVILGGAAVAHEEYSPEFFQRFRETNIIQAAVEYARGGCWEALEAIFTYHGPETLPHRLAVLSNFPETMSPSEYHTLLPEAGFSPDDPDVFEWEQESWREQDWVEKDDCKGVLGRVAEEGLAEFLYRETPDLNQYRCKLTAEVLKTWYRNRAEEIETLSKQVDSALELIKLGMERGIKGLEDLHDDLLTLGVVVYECSTDPYLGLKSFQKMSNLEKLRMLLGRSTEESFVKDFKSWAHPFLQRLDKRSKGTRMSLVHHYLTDVAKVDLAPVLKIFQHSTPELVEPIIADVADLMKLALECIYICKRHDQLEVAFSILECLPAPGEKILSQQIGELNKQVDKLESYLCACETLAKHGVEKTASFILDTQGDVDEVKKLLVTLTNIAAKRMPPIKEKDWKKLLWDMLALQNEVLSCVEKSVCYEIYVETLLRSGRQDNISLAKQMLCKTTMEEDQPPPASPTDGPRVPHGRSVELVLESAKEYFNSSADLSDSAMDLARLCLSLTEKRPPAVQEEFNLIAALGLLDDFHVSILPLQVRLCEDKLSLVSKALESSPAAYRKTDKVLRLASLVQVSGSDELVRRGRVLMLVAEHALQADDYTFACQICQQLIAQGYEQVWTVCRSVGECEDFKDLMSRQELLAFSVTYCTADALEALLNSVSLLETRILYEELSEDMQSEDQLSADLPEETGLLKTSKSLLTHMRDRDWWKNTVTWMRPLRISSAHNSEDTEDPRGSTEPLAKQGVHPFYRSLFTDFPNQEGLPYERFISQQRANNALHLGQSLLKTQKLSESRAEGAITEPATEVLLQLAECVLSEDTTQALAYLLALTEPGAAVDLFQKLHDSYLCLHVATYYFALELITRLTRPDSKLYYHRPDDVIEHVNDHVSSGIPPDWSEEMHEVAALFSQHHNQMTDFVQAQLLQSLGRGVDIGRFTQDPEYKRETILGLAMAQEEEVFSTAMSLASRYNVCQWEMLMTQLEWLFSDSSLSTKEIQDRVNKLDAMNTLLEEPQKMVTRMTENVYPTIEGTKHARLIYYYMLLLECEKKSGSQVGEDVLDAQGHLKLLKKLKSAAPGLDYKQLMNGDSPLEVLRPVISATNVHLLSKLVSKVPVKEDGAVQPSSVFRVFVEKLFWEGKKKEEADDDQIDWVHRYEACHNLLPKLSPADIVSFLDDITFSERAVDVLPLESRIEVTSRALRFARQQDAARKKKGIEDETEACGSGESQMTYEMAADHVDQLHRHLMSTTDPLIFELREIDEDTGSCYARLYDTSRSEADKICELVSLLLVDWDRVSLDFIQQLLMLAAGQKPQTWKTVDAVREILQIILSALGGTEQAAQSLLSNKDPMCVLERIIQEVSTHVKEGGSLVSQEDVLTCLRVFTADVTVPSRSKTAVLQVLESRFDLSGEDTFMLLFLQTDALVTATWEKKLSPGDIDSDTNRHQLFLSLLEESPSASQLLVLGSLLQIWPLLAATELCKEPLGNPWVQLLDKLIRSHGDGELVVELVKQLQTTSALGGECCDYLFTLMLDKCNFVFALKFCLVCEQEELNRKAMEKMKNSEVGPDTCDDEAFELLISRRLVASVAQTPFLTVLFDYVLRHPDGAAVSEKDARVKQVVSQLQTAGHWAEAGTLLMKHREMHPALRTLDSALGTLAKWFGR